MASTPEQKAADEALREAVIAARDARGFGQGGVVSDVLVIGVEHFFEDGQDSTGVFTLTTAPLPLYRTLGLIDFAQALYRGDVREGPESP